VFAGTGGGAIEPMRKTTALTLPVNIKKSGLARAAGSGLKFQDNEKQGAKSNAHD
jgi:hypothetical protein